MNSADSARRILVTGATGFVGRHLCQALTARGMEVVATTRGGSPIPGLRTAQLELSADPEAWRLALRGCDAVVHLAALAHDVRGQAAEAEYVRVNLEGTRFAAEQAMAEGVRRFIYVSSIKVNGEAREEAYGSADAPAPSDAYGRSKWAAEQALMALCAGDRMSCIRIRPPLVYGPGVKANFQRLLRLADSGIPLPLAGIDNRRSLIGAANLADFIGLCLTHPRASEQPWLVSDGEDLSTAELISRMRRLLGRPRRSFRASPAWMRRCAAVLGMGQAAERLLGTLQVDSGMTRTVLGWVPPRTLDAELARTVTAYRQERAR